MQRPLVLANEAARHPVRRLFPPPAVVSIAPERAPGENLRLFLMTFVAGFLAISGLIA